MAKQKNNKIKVLIVVDVLILVLIVILAIVSLSSRDISKIKVGGADPKVNESEKKDFDTEESPEDSLDASTKMAQHSQPEEKEPEEDASDKEADQLKTAEEKQQEEAESNQTEEPSVTPLEEAEDKEEEILTDAANDAIQEKSDIFEGLDGLSTKKIGWCFERKSNNEPSGTYEPFPIEPYGAYFLNRHVEEGDKVIYFSFDCGYEYGYTEKILDVLKKHNIKATFFVTKSFLDTDAELAKRMKEEGHIVGNHTRNHPSLPEKTPEEVEYEVRELENIFYEKTGYTIDKYIRPPMGEYSEKVLKELQNMGYTTIFWSIAYGDYDVDNQPGKDYVVDHFKKYHHNGAITLTHTVSKSNTEALDEVLTYLEDQGYRFGSLAELRTLQAGQ